MAFEIFIEPELEVLSDDAAAQEWQSICDTLNLKGQKSLTSGNTGDYPPPYMPIDEKTGRIIRTLCPESKDVASYDIGAIPLEVLQEIKRCKDNNWYDSISVYYDNKTPDPFVIGEKKTSEYGRTYHLIARWGAELLPWDLLEERAIARIKLEVAIIMAEAKQAVQFALDSPDLFAQKHLLDGRSTNINFHVSGLRW